MRAEIKRRKSMDSALQRVASRVGEPKPPPLARMGSIEALLQKRVSTEHKEDIDALCMHLYVYVNPSLSSARPVHVCVCGGGVV